MKRAALLCMTLAGCCPTQCSGVGGNAGSVILYHEGAALTSEVGKVGMTCWVSWYHTEEKVILSSDFTAHDGVLKYTWTLNVRGPVDRVKDKSWFDSNCKDGPE